MHISCQLQVVSHLIITDLIVYRDMSLHKITEFYTEWFIVCCRDIN
jgi:hypothetical protein